MRKSQSTRKVYWIFSTNHKSNHKIWAPFSDFLSKQITKSSCDKCPLLPSIVSEDERTQKNLNNLISSSWLPGSHLFTLPHMSTSLCDKRQALRFKYYFWYSFPYEGFHVKIKLFFSFSLVKAVFCCGALSKCRRDRCFCSQYHFVDETRVGS